MLVNRSGLAIIIEGILLKENKRNFLKLFSYRYKKRQVSNLPFFQSE